MSISMAFSTPDRADRGSCNTLLDRPQDEEEEYDGHDERQSKLVPCAQVAPESPEVQVKHLAKPYVSPTTITDDKATINPHILSRVGKCRLEEHAK